MAFLNSIMVEQAKKSPEALENFMSAENCGILA